MIFPFVNVQNHKSPLFHRLTKKKKKIEKEIILTATAMYESSSLKKKDEKKKEGTRNVIYTTDKMTLRFLNQEHSLE